jgi:hypothetical protein
LGLPRGEPPVPRPHAEIPRREPDGEFLLDQLAEPRAGPRLGLEPLLPRALGQPPADDLLLGGGQSGRPARDGAGEEALCPSFSMRGDPTTDRTRSDREGLGNLLDGVSREDSLDGRQAAAFMCFGRTSVSHD